MRVFAFGFALAAVVTCLVSAAIQSHNHERAHDLALIQRRCEMIEAANAQAEAIARAHVWGQPNVAPARANGAAPTQADVAATSPRRIEQ